MPLVVGAANISLVKIRDLDFPDQTQDSAAMVVSAGSGNSDCAKFTVTGDPGKSYTVVLPNSMTMKNGGSSITVNTFTHSSDNAYTLNGGGTDTLYVGATRAALPVGQTTGAYSGTFTTRVQYTTGGKVSNNSTTSSTTVAAAIAVVKVADMQFSDVVQGDPSQVINPASDSGRAQFTVTGEPNYAYSIALPGDGTITLITNGGATPQRQIAVNTFTSSPVSPDTIPIGGTRTLYVGATRAAIAADQDFGTYTATFSITVTYQ